MLDYSLPESIGPTAVAGRFPTRDQAAESGVLTINIGSNVNVRSTPELARFNIDVII